MSASQREANILLCARLYADAWDRWANPGRYPDEKATHFERAVAKSEAHQNLMVAVRRADNGGDRMWIERAYRIPQSMLTDAPVLEAEVKTLTEEMTAQIINSTSYSVTGKTEHRIVTPDDFLPGHEQAGIIIKVEVVV